MGGITSCRKIQIGVEATAGTAVAATVIYLAQGLLIDESEIIPVPEDIGQRVPYAHSYISQKNASLSVDDHPATFEQIGYWFGAGIEKVATVATDGGGSGHIYQSDLSNSTAATIDTYTIEGGNLQESNEMEYSYVEEFTLSGAAGEAVTLSGTWRGRQLSDCAFTSLSPTALEEILFGKGKIFLDDTAGTIGTTQKTNTWLGFSLTVNTGIRAIRSADGAIYFATHDMATPEVTGELTFRHDTTGEAETGKAIAESVRLVRMTFQGSALATAGTTYTYHTLNIDLAIQYTEIPTIAEDDGIDTITLPFRLVDSDSVMLQFIVVNELAALA